MLADLAARKQRGRPFRRGQSGNPAGRPAGVRNPITILAETLLQDQVEQIIAVITKAALGGNLAAAFFCVDKIVPPPRHRPQISLVPIREWNGDDALLANFRAIVAAVAGGEITGAEARDAVDVIERQHAMVQRLRSESLGPQPTSEESAEIDRRLAASRRWQAEHPGQITPFNL